MVSRQVEPYDLYMQDCLYSIGDGGGENTGYSGMHRLMITMVPSFVPRRCFEHTPWRVADVGLAESGNVYDVVKAHADLSRRCSNMEGYQINTLRASCGSFSLLS